MFQLTFRYVVISRSRGPVAVSRWRIELDARDNNFDPKSLSDVILHLHYTAREGGERLKAAARSALAAAIGEDATQPLARLFSLKHESDPSGTRLTRQAAASEETFTLGKERFPFLFRGKTVTAGLTYLYAVLKDGAEPAPLQLQVTPPGADPGTVRMSPRKGWAGTLAPEKAIDAGVVVAEGAGAEWVFQTGAAGIPKEIDDLLVVMEYAVAD